VSALSNDDFSRVPVPAARLRPWWNLLVIELGVLISIPMFVIGGQFALSLTLRDLIAATLLGGAILGLLGGLTARLGAQTRCSTAMIARATFGSSGAVCIGLMLALGVIGWWAVQLEMFVHAGSDLAHKITGVNLSRELMILCSGIAMITTAALGIKAIGKLAFIAAPILSVAVCYGLTTLVGGGGIQVVQHYQPPSGTALGFGAAVATIVGGWIVGATMNPDFARFARNKKHAVIYALGHYSFNYPIFMILCGIMAIGFNTRDVMQHIVPPGFSWLLLVLMMLATWAANDCNLYSSSLGLAAVIPKLNRAKLAIAAGIFGIILAEFRLGEHMVSFLVLLGSFLAPIAGVFIVNAKDPRDLDNPEILAPVPKLRTGALLAWACGATIGLMATPRESLGLGWLHLTTIPALDAVIAAGLITFALKVWHSVLRPLELRQAA
jgi:cytosine permease